MDAKRALDGQQTLFKGLRILARYSKIEGAVARNLPPSNAWDCKGRKQRKCHWPCHFSDPGDVEQWKKVKIK